jgi:hypothetical protein
MQNVTLRGNSAKDRALVHVTQNAYFEVRDSDFIENRGFDRGVLVFSEQENSISALINSRFFRNHGMYGGLFFTDNKATISTIDCIFN